MASYVRAKKTKAEPGVKTAPRYAKIQAVKPAKKGK